MNKSGGELRANQSPQTYVCFHIHPLQTDSHHYKSVLSLLGQWLLHILPTDRHETTASVEGRKQPLSALPSKSPNLIKFNQSAINSKNKDKKYPL